MTSHGERNAEWRELLKCFDLGIVIPALVAALALVGLAFIGRRFPAGTPMRVGVAVAQTLVFAYVVAITLLPIRRLDELHQRIHLVAIAIAFGVVGVVGTGAGFLARAGIASPAPGLWLWPVMVLTWALGVVVIARRYR